MKESEARERIRVPGKKYLQKGYIFHRNGEDYIVPLAAATKQELLSEIDRRLEMGADEHAAEILEYLKEREALACLVG